MLKIDEELPEIKFSPPFSVNLSTVKQCKMRNVLFEPVVYINANGRVAVDDKKIPEIHSLYDAGEKRASNISILYDEIIEKSLLNAIIIAADNETRWRAISAVMNEEVMRGAIGVNLMVKLRNKKLKTHPEIVQKLTRHIQNTVEIKEMGIQILPVTYSDYESSFEIRKCYGFLTNDSINLALMQIQDITQLHRSNSLS